MVRKRRRDTSGLERKPSSLQKVIARIPRGWLAAMVFSGFIGSFVLFMALLRGLAPGPFSEAEQCSQQCLPRAGMLQEDRDYPMSTRGRYRQICRCN